MNLQIGIQEKNLTAGAAILNSFLADEIMLYYRTRKAHWNVEGPGFYALHKLFESQYEILDDAIDDLAERIRALGQYANPVFQQHWRTVKSDVDREENFNWEDWAADLLIANEKIIVTLRDNINCFATELNDIGTSDFITGLMETHEKMAWMLRAQLT